MYRWGVGGLEPSVLACVAYIYGGEQPWGVGSGLEDVGNVYTHVTHANGSCGEVSVSTCLGLGISRGVCACI